MPNNKTKSLSEVVAYLEHPKVIREFHGSTLDGMVEVEFDTDTLRGMINALDQKQFIKLMEKVEVVCQQWRAIRVAPDNDIGTVARYQDAQQIIHHRVSDLASEGVADSTDVSNPQYQPNATLSNLEGR